MLFYTQERNKSHCKISFLAPTQVIKELIKSKNTYKRQKPPWSTLSSLFFIFCTKFRKFMSHSFKQPEITEGRDFIKSREDLFV